ncbi:MAG: type II methionyl aminopeptidase [Candidatus Aenigmarchaeota archaeon]|nr:type II methionyl aminopeptidase [Candidatus Aenigmarchaeota archaeon]
MDQKIIDNYVKAGKIASKVREEAKSLVKPGMKLIDLAEKLEKKIRDLGGVPAWPVNISTNEIAAHYSPAKGDDSVFGEKDLVKVDIGVAVDGYIADTTVSVALDKEDAKLVEAAEKALDEALKLVRPGADVADIAAKIEETIVSMGFKPIVNLTGHGLDQYTVHSEPKIPNHKGDFHYLLEEGEAIAIEPFATRGRNFITESDENRALTYTVLEEKPVRSMEARIILQDMRSREGMPFTDRWLKADGIKLKLALRELMEKECIQPYRILKGDSKISQAEHTVLVLDKPIVTTR